MMFCQDINTDNHIGIGSGKLDGDGIPVDFFKDIYVCKAFAHAIDYNYLKKEIANNLMLIPSSPNVQGLPFHANVG